MHRFSAGIHQKCGRYALFATGRKQASSGIRVTQLGAIGNFSSNISMLTDLSYASTRRRNFSTTNSEHEVVANLVDPSVSELGNTPVDYCTWALDSLHHTSGLPWWASIALMTLGFRLALFPLNIYTMRNAMRLSNLTPEMKILQEEMKEKPARNQEETMIYATKYKMLQDKHGVKLSHAFLGPVAQIPVFLTMFWTLRYMSANYPSMSTGGTLWFMDLTQADVTYGLPLICSASFLLMAELGQNTENPSADPAQAQRMKNIMRAMAVLMLPVTITQPSAITVYWSTTNCLSLLQSLVLRIPGIKPALGVKLKINPVQAPVIDMNQQIFSNKPRVNKP